MQLHDRAANLSSTGLATSHTAGSHWKTWWFLLALILANTGAGYPVTNVFELADGTIVLPPDPKPKAIQTAATMLAEELEKRIGKRLPVSNQWPEKGPAIALWSGPGESAWGQSIPRRPAGSRPEAQPEGYRMIQTNQTLWILGADPRGVLFGAGRLLRTIEWSPGSARIPGSLDVSTAPASPIRGHQLGYRARANSYDGWDPRQYEQYIRELVIFGANSVENIPFEDQQLSPHWPISRAEMNRRLSEICDRYDVDYWVWTPATFDLKDEKQREAELRKHEAFYRECPRLNGVFFPGADPGNNPPELVMPFLQDVAKVLAKYHPEGKVWVSTQGFNGPKLDYVAKYLEEQKPTWLGGIVAGPQTLPPPALRARLSPAYPIRDYPDITHTVRCQYPVTWWDPAFNFTLGRECCNPRPLFYTLVHRQTSVGTAGFISYSDGCHDDVNKIIWTRLGVEPQADPRETLVEYARFFFGPDVAEAAADGIMALEKNWMGPLVSNAGIDATLALWQNLEHQKPGLAGNWRWQLCLLRATYDAYLRHRQRYESGLEEEVNAVLTHAGATGAETSITTALSILRRTETQPCRPDLRTRIDQLCQALFDSVRLQTSVKRFQASESERGCVLDFVDYPLNNRWWLEDEFDKVRRLATEPAKVARLEELARWEHPGPGSYYDSLGDLGKSPHLVRGPELNTDPLVPLRGTSIPGFVWDQGGYSRLRLSWQGGLRPAQMVYENLDPHGQYTLRVNGRGEISVYANQKKLDAVGDPSNPSAAVDKAAVTRETPRAKVSPQFTNYSIPGEALKERRLVIDWGDPKEPRTPGSRSGPYVAEVWLLKNP